jgi:hypothetical protein
LAAIIGALGVAVFERWIDGVLRPVDWKVGGGVAVYNITGAENREVDSKRRVRT